MSNFELNEVFGGLTRAVQTSNPRSNHSDLILLFRNAWGLLPLSKKKALLEEAQQEGFIKDEAGELTGRINQVATLMRNKAVAAGVKFNEGELGFSWETEDQISLQFPNLLDAIEDAYELIVASDDEANRPTQRVSQ